MTATLEDWVAAMREAAELLRRVPAGDLDQHRSVRERAVMTLGAMRPTQAIMDRHFSSVPRVPDLDGLSSVIATVPADELLLHVKNWFSAGRWISDMPARVHASGAMVAAFDRLADTAHDLTSELDGDRLNAARELG
ncbi:MAG: hypothetical protein Q7U20_08495 [Caulobacter sp.]|nr:hypothetical protein [Caulobacter sp.]